MEVLQKPGTTFGKQGTNFGKPGNPFRETGIDRFYPFLAIFGWIKIIMSLMICLSVDIHRKRYSK